MLKNYCCFEIKKPVFIKIQAFQYGGRGRNRTGIDGFAIRCISHSATRP